MNLDEVLSGSAGLAGVQWALREKPTRRRLHAVVQSLLEPGWQPDVFRLRRAKYKPGRKLNAFFDVGYPPGATAGGAEERLFRPVAVTWKPLEPRTASENEADAAAQDEILQRGLAAPFRCLRAEHPEWALQILVSPLDPTFPQLARISDPATIGGMVDEAGTSRG